MRLRTRRFIDDVFGGLAAGVVAVALGLATALFIPDWLVESRSFVFVAFTAAVFIGAGLSLGFSLLIGAVLNRFIAMLGVHILVGMLVVAFMPEMGRTRLWMLLLLVSVETAVVRRIADQGAS